MLPAGLALAGLAPLPAFTRENFVVWGRAWVLRPMVSKRFRLRLFSIGKVQRDLARFPSPSSSAPHSRGYFLVAHQIYKRHCDKNNKKVTRGND